MSCTYQCEEDEEARDVSDHAAERDLQGAEHLEGGHEVGGAGDAQNIRHRKQHIRHDLRIIRFPLKPSWKKHLKHSTHISYTFKSFLCRFVLKCMLIFVTLSIIFVYNVANNR